MNQIEIVHEEEFNLILTRLAHQLIENHGDFSNAVLIGLQSRGVYLANRLQEKLQEILSDVQVKNGALDITFFRDDFRRGSSPLLANKTKIDFIIEGKSVILIDDVLFTGRTVRAGLDAMLAFGRPSRVELLVFIDRRYQRHLPIQPSYVGKVIDSVEAEQVLVEWKDVEGQDKVVMFEPQKI